jgi:hypothetical protein
MRFRFRDIFRPSQNKPETSPDRLDRLIKRYSNLQQSAQEKPANAAVIPILVLRLQMAAYLIKKAEAYADTRMMMAVKEAIPWEQGETAPALEAVVPTWKKHFVTDENRSNAMHINLEIVKARLEHLDSLLNRSMPKMEGPHGLTSAISDLRFIQAVAHGDKSVRKQVAKETGAAAAAGLLSGAIIGFLALKLSIAKMGDLVWFAVVPIALSALTGIGAFLYRKSRQEREARELITVDYEGMADRMQDSLERHSAQMYSDISDAIEVCDKGTEDLISGVLKMVDSKLRSKVRHALDHGLGPYWENEARN